ncbi:MAG: hypothetical protein DRO13_01565 [Thermoprotei archaeon]|nr:MAG: hypothetical protein DRO13_01565 [Thermoprotei archaeon]
MKDFIKQMLSKQDFGSILSSPDLSSAIKSIVETKLGIRLYEVVRQKGYTLNEVLSSVDSYNYERIAKLREISSKSAFVIDVFSELFDIVNAINAIFTIMSNKKPSPIFPTGIFARIDLSQVKNIEDLRNTVTRVVPQLSRLIPYIASARTLDYTLLFNTLAFSKNYMRLDHIVRKLYGFFRDTMLLRTCMFLEKTPDTVPSILSMTRSEFMELCGLGRLGKLPQLIRDINPLYTRFSEVLEDTYKLGRVVEAYDLGVLLYASNIVADFYQSIEQVVARMYTLYLAEAYLVKLALSSIYSGTFVEELKSIIEKWWVL